MRMHISSWIVILIMVGTTVCINTTLGQDRMQLRKSDMHSGYAHVSGATVSGHVSVGLPMAERVTGSSMKGWIGFYPAKMPTVSSVDEEDPGVATLSPNPASTYCEVEHGQGARVAVYSMLGERLPVSVLSIGSVSRINVSAVAEGSYTIVIEDGQQRRTLSLIILR